MMAKKIIYVTLFTLLGVLVQFLIQSAVEIQYINLLLTKYEIFGFGLPFSTWFVIHEIFASILLAVGFLVGLSQGLYWWKRLYEK